MTSLHNHKKIKTFFKKNIKNKKVKFFKQNEINNMPLGHGDVFLSMKKNNIFKWAKKRKIKHFFIFQNDNPLVFLNDFNFIKTHLINNNDITCKVVKRIKNEPCSVLKNKKIIDWRKYRGKKSGIGFINVFLTTLNFAKKISKNPEKYTPLRNFKRKERIIMDIIKHTNEKQFIFVDRKKEFFPIKSTKGMFNKKNAQKAYNERNEK